ncbi:MAG: hypothetical protein Q9202_002187 [Teloschistes flavicans]
MFGKTILISGLRRMREAQIIPDPYSTADQFCIVTNHQVKSDWKTSGGVVGIRRAITATQALKGRQKTPDDSVYGEKTEETVDTSAEAYTRRYAKIEQE